MLACDTNILFPAIEASHPQHAASRAWLEARIDDDLRPMPRTSGEWASKKSGIRSAEGDGGP